MILPEVAVVNLLLADAGVAALAGDRVTPGYLTHNGAFPAISVRRAAGSANVTFGGVWVEDTMLDITCWGPGWAEARQLAEAVRSCLRAYSGGAIAIITISDGADYPAPETGEYACVLIANVHSGEE